METVGVPLSGDVYIDSLVEGPKWATTALSYSFPTSADQFTGYAAGSEPFNNFEALNTQQQSAVRWALGQVVDFTDLTFTESTGSSASSAVQRFGMSDDPSTAWAYEPDSSDLGGDVWFNNSTGWYDAPVTGNYAWDTIMHEIGHTLGLGHPQESTPPMPLDRDWMAYTVMSYRSYEGAPITSDSTYTNGEWGYAQSYMMEDIAALQFTYGANFNFRNTDTTYAWSPTTGEMFVNGVGQGAPGGDTIFMTIWDGGGNDTFDFSNHAGGITVDLRPGSFTSLGMQMPDPGGGAAPGNIATSLLYQGDPRSLIENAIGTNGNDTMYGNQADNHLVGGNGNDTLYGYEGNDTLDGGAGYNWLYGGDGNDTLNGGPDGNVLDGGAGADHLNGGDGADILDGGDGNDVLVGAGGDDTLQGGAGADTLDGGAGNDSLDGGSGADRMIGGPGNDTYVVDDPGDVVIENANEGTDTVSASISYTLPAEVENGTLTGTGNIDLTGNDLDNVLKGNSGNNILDGGAGADVMRGGGGDDTYYVDNPGDWVFDGGLNGGTDTIYSSVSYTLIDRDPNFDPYAGASILPLSDGDNHIEFLILTGSANLDATGNSFDNTITGNAGANVLDGKAGNDTLIGGDGNDTLISGTGTDTLNGGAGDDGLYFGANLDPSDSADGGPGFDQLGLQGDYSGGLTLGAGNLVNIEELVLLPGNDTRFGDTAGNHYSYDLTTVDANVAAGQQLVVNFNTLQAGENVTFNGSAETDGSFLTYGGLGNDTITGGQQDDGFYFGYGRWGAGDSVDGQGGTLDQLGLQGDYTAAGSGAIVFGASQLTGIEEIVCLSGGDARFGAPSGSGYSYDLTMDDGNVGPGQTLVISANTLLAAGGTLIADETLTFNGSAETDGSFVVYGGAGADTITGGAGDDQIWGGAGNDTIAGGLGADLLHGGAGDNLFAYHDVADSTSVSMDQILDFSTGDKIDLSAIDAVPGGTDDPFTFVGSAAFSDTAGELRVEDEGGGVWHVLGDITGNGTADLVISVTTDHALTSTDFVL